VPSAPRTLAPVDEPVPSAPRTVAAVGESVPSAPRTLAPTGEPVPFAGGAAPGERASGAPPWWAQDAQEPGVPGGLRALLGGVRWRVPPRTAALAVVALCLLGGAVALRAAATPSTPPVTLPEPAVSTPATDPAGAAPSGAASAATVWVHVVGRVAAPGLVSLPAGSRVAEAIEAAGGALPDADLAAVNLAAPVQDGAQVHVPAHGEVVAEAPAAAGAGSGQGALLDVNTASAADLEALPGVGPVLAERIVTWRAEHGRFADVDDLLDVPGIGPAVLGQIRDLVRV